MQLISVWLTCLVNQSQSWSHATCAWVVGWNCAAVKKDTENEAKSFNVLVS